MSVIEIFWDNVFVVRSTVKTAVDNLNVAPLSLVG